MVGLDTAAEPSRYVRIFVSSKRIEQLAPGSGELRWSASGKRALLDGAEGVVVADVTTGTVQALGADSRVDWLVWQDEERLVGVVRDEQDQLRMSRITLSDRSVQPVGDALTAPIDRLLGVFKARLYVQTGTSITTVPFE
jgi:hypothetical protein